MLFHHKCTFTIVLSHNTQHTSHITHSLHHHPSHIIIYRFIFIHQTSCVHHCTRQCNSSVFSSPSDVCQIFFIPFLAGKLSIFSHLTCVRSFFSFDFFPIEFIFFIWREYPLLRMSDFSDIFAFTPSYSICYIY